ncbi:glycosyltransferase family 2 protein [Catellatospora sp. KI3]|uniref:glycosyltransferase family 2 protein n=1 Tax=Catellatospora sp. KI3 TaxID=3041620 RepID=UPI0024824AD9|nr:glycosyltransferase family 2 protein [Catellatospora sp. KI3]MDI1460069.1 glycosyltransferase family 2 protein [Catellatospora sp. KI3]
MRRENPSTSPRLSVIVPVYGVEAFLGECLDSILSYDGADLEVVAVDDCSPDGSGAILEGYAVQDSRVKAVHLRQNVGLGGARNAGLEHATGRYVWFVDSDDVIPEGSVRAVLDRLALHEPDVLIIDHAVFFPDGRFDTKPTAPVLGDTPVPLHLSQAPQLLRLAQSACTKIARRGLLDEARLRFRSGLYEDSAYSHPLLMAAASIDVLPRVCYLYRQQTPGAITSSVSKRHFDVFEQYQRLFDIVDSAGGRYDVFRPELFRIMINHYLVILGHGARVPGPLRRAFFRRMVEDYRRRLPAAGYAVPGGGDGLKHSLVRRNAYSAYAALRQVHRTRQRLTGSPVTAPARIPAQRLPVPQDAPADRVG